MLDYVPYQTLKLLGWITVVLVSLSASIKILILLNKLLARANQEHPLVQPCRKILKKLIPVVYSYHAPMGLVALLSGLAHGYLLLRRFNLNNGYVTWLFMLLLGVSGMLMKVNRKSKLYQPLKKIHYALTYVTLFLMIAHVVMMG